MSNLTTPSSSSSCNKSISRPSKIIVRQTLTSKLRAERGDKFQFLKCEIEKLKAQAELNGGSKKSLNSTNTFKVPTSTTLVNKKSAPKPKVIASDTISNKINLKTTESAIPDTKSENKLLPKRQITVDQNKPFSRTTNSDKNVKTDSNAQILATKPQAKRRVKLDQNPSNNCTLSSDKNARTVSNTPAPQAKPIPKSQTKFDQNNLIKSTMNSDKNVKTSSDTQPIKTVGFSSSFATIHNKSIVSSAVSADDKFKNRFSIAPNSNRSASTSKFNQGQFSLLSNQIKVNSKNVENPRRQTVMLSKKEPVAKFLEKSKPIVNKELKSAMKTSGTITYGAKKTVTVKSPLRKSLSAIHFKRVSNCDRKSTIHRTVSWSNGLSPVRTSPRVENITFRTPSMAKRRSVYVATPMSPGDVLSPQTINSTPETSDLKKRLYSWLQKKGKPLDSFHHLQCFGLASIEEENKENIEVFVPGLNDSYESLNIEKKSTIDDSKNILIANDAMYDLHTLILEGYTREQCEAWLDIIVSKFEQVQEKPQYWECRAALEESRGNFQSAIDFYEKAITKGAEVQKMNETLDILLEKFSVLNISQTESKPNEQRTKDILDARNVFKSSVINFAIKERDKKLNVEEGCQFVATPVRRSTRISRSGYVTTPNIKICSTLDELDSSVKKTLHFQPNRGFTK